MISVKKNREQINRLIKMQYCKHCHEEVVRESNICPICRNKTKTIYKEIKNG